MNNALDTAREAVRLIATLNRQEKQIIAFIVSGHSITSIAASLSIDPHFAEHAKQLIMKKLSARSTADVVRIGIYAGVSSPR
jgi:FixJ family two-component response regulator